MGELPDQLDANLRILERLQLQLSEREQTLRDEKSRLSVIENQIESNRKILAESREAETVSEEGDVLSLELLKAQLNTYPEKQLYRSPPRCHQAEGPNCRHRSHASSRRVEIIGRTPGKRFRGSGPSAGLKYAERPDAATHRD